MTFSLYCLLATIMCIFFFFFFNDTATTEIYTLSLHDALPICRKKLFIWGWEDYSDVFPDTGRHRTEFAVRSEEHTSELQSQSNLVCRLLLEKKKKRVKKVLSINTTR